MAFILIILQIDFFYHPLPLLFQQQPRITILIIPTNFFSNNISKNSLPGTPQGQCPTPGCPRLWTSPRWSWKAGNNKNQLIFMIPNNFCFKNITKKSLPGTPQGQCPTPACLRLWSSPRWLWTFRNN